MLRAIEKSGMDPLQAQQARDPNRLLAKAQGPVIALGGLLLIGIGGEYGMRGVIPQFH